MDRETREYFEDHFDKLGDKIDKQNEVIQRIDKTVALHSSILGGLGTLSFGGALAWVSSWFNK